MRSAWLVLALALLGGCAADKPKPTPLESYAAKASGRQVWNLDVGRFGFSMVPSVRDGVFYVASGGGEVLALEAETGAVRWRASAGEALSAGVGSDGRFASVVTRGNEVVTFDNGQLVWRKRIPSSVVTPPLVAGERVFVMSVDRAVHAFDAIDGRRLWTLQRPGDPLTLAKASVLGAYMNTLLVAQGSRLVGVDPLRGTVQWDVPLASVRGSNEVERLATWSARPPATATAIACGPSNRRSAASMLPAARYCGRATPAEPMPWEATAKGCLAPTPAIASPHGERAPATWPGPAKSCSTAA